MLLFYVLIIILWESLYLYNVFPDSLKTLTFCVWFASVLVLYFNLWMTLVISSFLNGGILFLDIPDIPFEVCYDLFITYVFVVHSYNICFVNFCLKFGRYFAVLGCLTISKNNILCSWLSFCNQISSMNCHWWYVCTVADPLSILRYRWWSSSFFISPNCFYLFHVDFKLNFRCPSLVPVVYVVLFLLLFNFISLLSMNV